MADCHAPAPADAVGEIADKKDIEVVDRIAAIQMNVDVDIEFLGEREDALDLAGAIGIVPRCATDDWRSAFQRCHHVRLATLAVGPAFLQEHAKLQVDGPGVIFGQALDRVVAAQADVGIDFDLGPHVGHAI